MLTAKFIRYFDVVCDLMNIILGSAIYFLKNTISMNEKSL